MAYNILAAAKYERDTHIIKYEYKVIDGFPKLISTGNSEDDKAIYDKNLAVWIHANPLTSKLHNQ